MGRGYRGATQIRAARLLSLFAGTGPPARPEGRHDPIPYSLVTVETPSEPTWPLGRSVRDSQVHSAPAPASALTVPDSLSCGGRLLVLFAVVGVLDCRQYTHGSSPCQHATTRLTNHCISPRHRELPPHGQVDRAYLYITRKQAKRQGLRSGGEQLRPVRAARQDAWPALRHLDQVLHMVPLHIG